ncbi:AAEL000907-PA [Aedes aegypti]|uniref:AAEL000907-PA n=1 Tax=Aedes aegypti TaxID=7159 RepID=Q17MV0_AEDAE|nr:AAEL000907-PA [Aedes aegypti]
MTANEINTLTRFLPLMIGNLVPSDDPVWQYLCSLLKIFDIIMLHDIPVELIDELKRLVEFHHLNYVNLFQDTLKPKHHNIVHYATAMTMSGSLRRQWGMRCEAKHKEAKQYCRVNCNKRNICSSLISKFCFKYAFDVFNNQFVLPFIDIKNENIRSGALPDVCEPLANTITCNGTKTFKLLSKFTKQNSLYEKGTIFCLRQKLIRNVYEIKAILLINDTDIMLLCYLFNSKFFDDHLQSFLLEKEDKLRIVTNIERIDSIPINIHYLNGNMYLRMCNFVSINCLIGDTVSKEC